MNDALKDLYNQVIVTHSKSPHHEGPLPGATHEATVRNPLCGDEVTVRVRLDGDRIAEVAFESRGCILSRASASLMTDAALGREVAATRALGRDVEAYAGGTAVDPERIGDLKVFEGVRDYPSRVACVALPWQALDRATSG